jgi:hypothetical protein
MKQLMFSLLLVVLVAGFANAQLASATDISTIQVTLASGISLTGGSFALADLVPGQTYSVYFNTGSAAWEYMDPFLDPTTPAAPSDWTELAVTALPGSNVVITFVSLPSKLVATDGPGAINLTYPRAWVSDGSIYTSFNPNVPFTYQLTGGITDFTFAPEIVFNVDKSAAGTTYDGVFVTNVAYSGF